MQQKNNITKIGLWFLPTWNEAIVYTFLVVVIFIVSNISSIEQTLEIQKSTLSVQNVILSPANWAFSNFGGGTFARIFPQVIFWGFVGFLVYCFILFVRSFTSEIFNDVDESNYVKPTNIGRWAEMRETIQKYAIRFFVLILSITYVIIFLRLILPSCTDKFRATIHFTAISQLIYGLLAAVLLGLGMHIFTILVRFIKLRRPSSY